MKNRLKKYFNFYVLRTKKGKTFTQSQDLLHCSQEQQMLTTVETHHSTSLH